MDQKKKEQYGEGQRAYVKGTRKIRRMMGVRRADENQESLGNRRVEPSRVDNYGDDRSRRWHADHRRDCDQISGYGPSHQEMRGRPHRHHDHSRRSTRSILHEKQHLERLVYALQRRLRGVDRQLKHRMEHRCRQEIPCHDRGASRF
jgi:hypothetical protein